MTHFHIPVRENIIEDRKGKIRVLICDCGAVRIISTIFEFGGTGSRVEETEWEVPRTYYPVKGAPKMSDVYS